MILTHFDAELFARDAERGSDGQLAFVTTSTGPSAEAVRSLPSSLERSWRYTFGLLRPARFPSWQRRRRPQAGAWAPGSFCAVRRSAWDAVGGFDDRFFLYYEDVDLFQEADRSGVRDQDQSGGHRTPCPGLGRPRRA